MTVETQGGGSTSMIDRIKRILLQPKVEWDRIDAEPATVGGIFRNWVLILAAIPPVAGLIGALLFGYSALGFTYKPGVVEAVSAAVVQYVLAVVGVFILSLIIDALAPTFGGTKDKVQATKVAAYSMTASWVAGIFGLVPALMILSILGLYGLYLLYLGLPKLMKVAAEKAMAYTAAIIVAGIVMFLLIGALTAPIAGMFGGGRSMPAGDISGTVNIPGGGSLDLGKLEESTKKLEAMSKQMEAGATQAAVAPEALQALLPESLGAFRRTEISSSGANAGGLGGSAAEGRYLNGESNLELKVTDIAAAGALAAMGSAFNVQSNRETETGYEKTTTVDGRMITEKWDKQSQQGSYSVLVGNRFMVEASGKVASIDVLRDAVAAIGLSKLESLGG